MEYKILYIEDSAAYSIKNNLERMGFSVSVNPADEFNDVLTDINENGYDAYIMDFRLTANQGRVDAPTFASTLRTHGKNYKNKPIILISDEGNLPEFNNDFTSQDLFDLVVSKTKFRRNLQKYSNTIQSLICAYNEIVNKEYSIEQVLGIESTDQLDYRFLEKLNNFKTQNNPYGFCRTIFYTLIRSIGALIGEDVLAARLGIDKSSEDFSALLDNLKGYKYSGIMSKSYDRWWFEKIIVFWNSISGGKSLRRTKASERVNIINSALGLNLKPAEPIKLSSSTTYWTICSQEQKPLDPIDGYVYNNKQLEVWQEPEYISLYSALENPDLLAKLSPIDRQDIIEIGKNVSI